LKQLLHYKIYGIALIALVTNQSVVFLIALWMLRKHPIINLENFKGAFDKSEVKKLAGFAAMAITSAIVVPVSHLIVRNYIGETISWDDAGYWQAIWYISIMYLMVVTTTISVYYLPRLSEVTEKTELRREILGGYKIIMPIVLLTSITIFLFKDFIIWFLFTEDFAPMKELFLWQLVGNSIKIASLLLGFIVVAKSMTKTYIFTEAVFSFSFVVMSIWMVQGYGLIGVTYAFALNYFLHFLVMAFVTKKYWSTV
jgi:O-antigen/teichoic acid export membrane protein